LVRCTRFWSGCGCGLARLVRLKSSWFGRDLAGGGQNPPKGHNTAPPYIGELKCDNAFGGKSLIYKYLALVLSEIGGEKRWREVEKIWSIFCKLLVINRIFFATCAVLSCWRPAIGADGRTPRPELEPEWPTLKDPESFTDDPVGPPRTKLRGNFNAQRSPNRD